VQQFVRITVEKDRTTTTPPTGGYNSGPKVNPTLNTDYIWVDYGTQTPTITQTFTPWNIQSVVPKRGLTSRLSGSEQYKIAGTINTVLYHEQAPFWKKAVLEPTFDPTSFVQDLPSYCIDRVVIGNGGIVWKDRFTGVKFSGATVTGSNDGGKAPVSIQANFIGSTRIDLPDPQLFPGGTTAVPKPGTLELPVKPYRWNKSTLTLGTGATAANLDSIIRSWTIDIKHMLTERMNKGATVNAMAHHGWTPTLAAVWDVDSWDFKTRYLNIINGMASVQYPESNLVLSDLTSTGTLTFKWINLVLTTLTDNFPVNDFLTQNAQLTPHFDSTAANLDLTVAHVVGTTPTAP
jgi:hypothetical protein